jgi:hypothetical protein
MALRKAVVLCANGGEYRRPILTPPRQPTWADRPFLGSAPCQKRRRGRPPTRALSQFAEYSGILVVAKSLGKRCAPLGVGSCQCPIELGGTTMIDDS